MQWVRRVNDVLILMLSNIKSSHLVIRPGLSTAWPRAASYSAVLERKQC